MKKKIHITGCVGIPAQYGGFETFAENLSYQLIDNYEIYIICSSKIYKNQTNIYNGVHRVFINLKANGILSLLYDTLGIFKSVILGGTILQLGGGAGFQLSILRLFYRDRIIVHIDGNEWKRLKWNMSTKLFLKISTLLSIRSCHFILIDNMSIKKLVPEKFHSKIIYAGYGADHLPELKVEVKRSKDILVIARAEPENQLLLLLQTFLELPQFNFTIVSNWKSTNYGRKLLNKYSDIKHIQLIPAIYDDQEKLQLLRKNCGIYIHPHSAGGTNPSLVEAMFSGIPVFAMDTPSNRETTENKALFFTNGDELKQLLNETPIEKLESIANVLQNIGHENYTWSKVKEAIIPHLDCQ